MASSTLPLSAFTGLSATTGAAVSGEAHLLQSLRDIITTPIGSRVMNRLYGSRVPSRLDAPMSRGLVATIVADVADAVSKWEPRIRLRRVVLSEVAPGQMTLALIDRDGRRFDLGAIS